MANQVLLMSLDSGLMRSMKALRPDWTAGLLTAAFWVGLEPREPPPEADGGRPMISVGLGLSLRQS